MGKYLLAVLDIALLGADIAFGTDILGLEGHLAVIAGAVLYLMFGCMVAMMLLSTGLLSPLQRRCCRGVLSAILLPWSTTLIAMAVTPDLLRQRDKGSTPWKKSRNISKN